MHDFKYEPNQIHATCQLCEHPPTFKGFESKCWLECIGCGMRTENHALFSEASEEWRTKNRKLKKAYERKIGLKILDNGDHEYYDIVDKPSYVQQLEDMVERVVGKAIVKVWQLRNPDSLPFPIIPKCQIEIDAERSMDIVRASYGFPALFTPSKVIEDELRSLAVGEEFRACFNRINALDYDRREFLDTEIEKIKTLKPPHNEIRHSFGCKNPTHYTGYDMKKKEFMDAHLNTFVSNNENNWPHECTNLDAIQSCCCDD